MFSDMRTRELEWQLFETLTDLGSAKVRIAVLEREGVPARLVSNRLALGLEEGYHVFVPANLLHRAKWVSSQSRLSDAELDYLATGELTDRGPNES